MRARSYVSGMSGILWFLLMVLVLGACGRVSHEAPEVLSEEVTTLSTGVTYVVNTTADTGSLACTDPVEPCSLRSAIQKANSTANQDTITFAILETDDGYVPAADGVHAYWSIAVASVLPAITNPVVLDGWSQGGEDYSGPPLIELNGENTVNQRGLRIHTTDTVVRGLAINRFLMGVDINGLGGSSVTDNKVQGNYIGTDVTGMVALGNGYGVHLHNGANNNTIGGDAAGMGNIISGNTQDGVRILGSSATGNRVQGNYIGVDATGVGTLGNTLGGVVVTAGASSNIISRNAINHNGGLGIDLGNNGVTLNDPGDADTGANNLQNYPVLSQAATAGTTTVEGALNSTPNTTFTLEFFSQATCDPSGHGEGETFRGDTTVITDGDGNASFSFALSSSVPVGHVITATVTDPGGNTSEFSACQEVEAAGYAFEGFFAPVNNDALNVAKAGSGIPVKFSLGGDQGLGIMATGSPSSRQVACDGTAPQDPVEETVTAGKSSLSYDALADQYVYVWKTEKAWAGSCYQLTITLGDGTSRSALFRFTR